MHNTPDLKRPCLQDITDKCLFKVLESSPSADKPEQKAAPSSSAPASTAPVQTTQQSTSNNNTNNYYHEYCRLYLANVVLTSQARQLAQEKAELISKIAKFQKKYDDANDCSSDFERASRRHRRQANQILRHYRCPVETCQKSYGSEGSLSQHIKNKHPEVYALMPEMHSENSSGNSKRLDLIPLDKKQSARSQVVKQEPFSSIDTNIVKLQQPTFKLARRRTLFY